jgi:hypothetical protein
VLLAGLLAAAVGPLAARQASDPIGRLRRVWQMPPADARPMMRWWWFGPAVTTADLTAELTRMRDAGIGGVEVQPVYPLTPDEPSAGRVNAPYLSSGFLAALKHTASTARSLGLRFDLTLGSGWPYGGPHIPIDRAAGRLRWERVPVRGRRVPLPDIGAGESLIAVLLPDGRRELTEVHDGAVHLPPGEGPAEIWVFIASRTGMMVKRAAVGAEGYVLDHYDRAALQAHLDAVGVPMLEALGPDVPAAVFCDSLEVFASDWTGDLLDEFRRRRGYELRAHLGALVAGRDADARGVRHDWALTLSELYVERFLLPLAEWSRGRGSRLRIQGYGIPPATLSSNRHADLTDGEGWQWQSITASRWASSAGHLFGRPVTASETWTWLHSPSFRATPLDLKAEADRHFLQGINQIIGHGWPSTPSSVAGAGWRFYAAGAFNDRNPWFIVMPDVSRYLQRVSALLREGRPVNDVALYLPTADALADVTPGRAHLLDLLRERVGTAVPGGILRAGLGFDLIDDGALGEGGRVEGALLAVGEQRFRAVVLPAVETIPLRTLRLLDGFAKSGGIVIATDRAPAALPGRIVTEAERLEAAAILGRLFGPGLGPARVVPAAALVQALGDGMAADVRLAPQADAVGYVHRQTDEADVYFLANTHNQPYAGMVTVRARGRAEWWDPITGETASAPVARLTADTVTLPLTLPAYGSRLLVVARAGGVPIVAPPGAGDPRTTGPTTAVAPAGWRVALPGREARELTALRSWHEEESSRFVSGVAVYEARVTLPRLARGQRVRLELGEGTPLSDAAAKGPGMRTWLDAPVRDAAVVAVNGTRAGSVWAPPWALDLTPHVRPGVNELRIEVGNTLMNAMAGRAPSDYRLLHLRYGERFQPQDMDQVQPLPSGLVGEVRVVIAP